jgi:hypothetical protein
LGRLNLYCSPGKDREAAPASRNELATPASLRFLPIIPLLLGLRLTALIE